MKSIIRKINTGFVLAVTLSPDFYSACRFLCIFMWVSLRKRLSTQITPLKLKIKYLGKILIVYVFNPTDFATIKEIYIDQEYKVEMPIIPRVIIDIGSNVGYSVLYWKSIFPQSVVHAYEPDPDTF